MENQYTLGLEVDNYLNNRVDVRGIEVRNYAQLHRRMDDPETGPIALCALLHMTSTLSNSKPLRGELTIFGAILE